MVRKNVVKAKNESKGADSFKLMSFKGGVARWYFDRVAKPCAPEVPGDSGLH